eukprot:1153539-Pleurochrysis_carterae.AAC.3
MAKRRGLARARARKAAKRECARARQSAKGTGSCRSTIGKRQWREGESGYWKGQAEARQRGRARLVNGHKGGQTSKRWHE